MKGILIDENGNMIIRGGTMVIGDVESQICEHLLVAFTGEYKQEPLLGGNAKNMIAGTPDPFWAGYVKQQLKTCKVDVQTIRVVNDDIEVILK